MLYSQNNSVPFHSNLTTIGACGEQVSCFPAGYTYPHMPDLALPTTSFSSYINSGGITTMMNAVVMNSACQPPALYPPWNASLPCGIVNSNQLTPTDEFPFSPSNTIGGNHNASFSFSNKENNENMTPLLEYKHDRDAEKSNIKMNIVDKENRHKLPLQTVNSNCIMSADLNTLKIYDEKYWERRQKNNEAAKHSRSKRRDRENQLRKRVTELETENKLLRKEIYELRKYK